MVKRFSVKKRALLLLLVLTIISSLLFAGCENPGAGNETANPTLVVTAVPSIDPTLEPTYIPTHVPTLEPTAGMTSEPITTPTPTPDTTPEHTATPTQDPTATPTQDPTATPTQDPTATPTQKPTATPTQKPTATPTQKPTATPTQKPTATPTQKPTATPTQKPTATPTQKPTATPTQKPTATPTQKPTATPTQKPTATPTQKPTATPTQKPTATPTQKPTATPTQKPTVTPIRPLTAIPKDDYYARQWLLKQNNSTNLLELYDSFVSAAESLSGSVTLDKNCKINTQEFNSVFHCYLIDYPQHFWISGSVQYQMSSGNVISYTMNYGLTGNSQKEALNNFNKQAESILKELNGNMSEFEREKIIHDYLVLNCTYNKNAEFCHTAYGALVNGQAVCDGYTKAFQYLCREAGIQTSMVEGVSINYATNSYENHAWNFIKINGNYYFADVTWDDAGEPDSSEKIHYTYYNCTSDFMNKDHKIKDTYEYPVPETPSCTATEENYYIKNNAVLESFDAVKIANCAVKKGETYICKFLYLGDENLNAWLQSNFSSIRVALNANIRRASITTVGNEYTITFS